MQATGNGSEKTAPPQVFPSRLEDREEDSARWVEIEQRTLEFIRREEEWKRRQKIARLQQREKWIEGDIAKGVANEHDRRALGRVKTALAKLTGCSYTCACCGYEGLKNPRIGATGEIVGPCCVEHYPGKICRKREATA